MIAMVWWFSFPAQTDEPFAELCKAPARSSEQRAGRCMKLWDKVGFGFGSLYLYRSIMKNKDLYHLAINKDMVSVSHVCCLLRIRFNSTQTGRKPYCRVSLDFSRLRCGGLRTGGVCCTNC